MSDLILADPPTTSLGSSSPDEIKLAQIIAGIQGLEKLLSENISDPRKEKQARRMLADLVTWAERLVQRIEEQQAAAGGPERAERDLYHTGNGKLVGSTVGPGRSFTNGDAVGGDKIEIHLHGDEAAGRQISAKEQAERAYLQWLLERARRVPLGDLDVHTLMNREARDIQLEEIFVQLDIKRTQGALERGDDPECRVQVPVLDAINRTRVLVILGDPGAGKTTLLNFLTFCLAGARLNPLDGRYLDCLNLPQSERRPAVNWSHGALLPIRIDLRDFVQTIPPRARKGTSKLLLDHIAGDLEAHGFEEFAGEVKRMLRSGQCLVMLDGLDEIARPQQRHIVRDAINDFADCYPESRFIVTCRRLSYTDPDWRLDHHKNVTDVTLERLSPDSIHEFIGRWYEALVRRGTRSRETADEKAEELRHAVRWLDDLAGNPMLLTVMCVVHTYRGKLPRERARLYYECIELLLWKWTEPRLTPHNGWEQGIVDQLGIRQDRLVSGLCALAFRMQAEAANGHPDEQDYSAHTVNIPRSEVLNVLSSYLDNDQEKAGRFCDYVEQQAGLLVGRGQPRAGEAVYAFPHRGFQEFLAAWHLISEGDFAHLMADLARQSDVWYEVLMLATGHLVFNYGEIRRPLVAINTLVKPEPPADAAGWRSVWWAADMLSIIERPYAESDEHVGKHVVPRVMRQLVQLVQEGHLSAVERAKAGDALGRLGDPRPGVCSLEPEMVRIEGGRFKLGEGDGQHTVTLKPFAIARYPVTNAQFRAFFEEAYADDSLWTAAGLAWRETARHQGGYLDDALWGIGNRPVAGVTWYEAIAYVNWLRRKTSKPYRLLTEAEWERAAAGLERRKYPFGSRAGDGDVNTRESGVGQTSAVGIFPKDQTPDGVYDMGGNVWEWTSTRAVAYPYKADDGREKLSGAGGRVLRGGAYDKDRSHMRCHLRLNADPRAAIPLIGLRLARDA